MLPIQPSDTEGTKWQKLGASFRLVAEGVSPAVPPATTEVTGDRDLAVTDAGAYLYATAAATLTVPFSVFEVGTVIHLFQATSGQLQLAFAEGIGIYAKDGNFGLAGQGSNATLTMIAPNVWTLTGDLVNTNTPALTTFGWGLNDTAQLGFGATPSYSINPLLLPLVGAFTGKTIAQSSVGRNHALFLLSDHTIAAVGTGTAGQLGDGLATSSAVPVVVDMSGVLAGKTVIKVVASSLASYALCSDGTVAAWGSNGVSQIGDGTAEVQRNTPVLALVSEITDIAVGQDHVLALTQAGTVFAWGYNGDGALGNGTTVNNPTPAVVTGGALTGRGVLAVAAGRQSICACTDGVVVGWGSNGLGSLGDNTNEDRLTPVLTDMTGVLAGKVVVAVACGNLFTIARCDDGFLAAWGYGGTGALGNGETVQKYAPVAVNVAGVLAGKVITEMACGWLFTAVMATDGNFYTWGDNDYGELGDGTFDRSSLPVLVPNPVGYTAYRLGTQNCTAYGMHGLFLPVA